VAAIQVQEHIVIKMVHQVRRKQPRIGGKKLYSMLKPNLDKLEGSMGRDKFFELLGKHKLLVKRKKKYVRTTNSWHHYRRYKNALKNALLTGPNQAFVSDITYLRAGQGFMYLFLQTDAYSRAITGWHLSESLGISGALAAMQMTVKQCLNLEGVIHHSDRGIQYCCKEYVTLLKKHKMIISMTEDNHCYENAIAERVNGILKQDFLLDEKFIDKAAAMKAVKEAIKTYNNDRPHWSLGLCTPMQVHQAA
jgi:transposase InsO family protein